VTADEPHAQQDRHATELTRNDPLWPGQLAVLTSLGLYFALPAKLTIGPNWMLPIAEGALVLGLIGASRRGRTIARRRDLAVGLALIVTLTNLVALILLVHYLLAGGTATGTNLIGGGVVIWCTNLLLFAVLYWELDRGGPLSVVEAPEAADLLFPQMTEDRYTAPDWKPRFGDYLYVSLTNQTAFSPTDTMPLTSRIKLLMGVQGVASLVTVGVVVARAVNILA
jgi:uncharacterized membrane protein